MVTAKLKVGTKVIVKHNDGNCNDAPYGEGHIGKVTGHYSSDRYPYFVDGLMHSWGNHEVKEYADG